MPVLSLSPPRVSVVIPLYNHGKYIEEALQSVLNQTFKAWEIIVIDDGSTDESAEKVRKICKNHPEIIFWSWSNQGAHHTLNAGVLRATGDFVAILNSDDCYHPKRIESCLAAFAADPGLDVVFSHVNFMDGDGLLVSNDWYDKAIAYYKEENDFALALINANFLVSTSNIFIRRSVFESIGLFLPLRYTHDLEFYLRLYCYKKIIHVLSLPLLNYRVHDNNTIKENTDRSEIERAFVYAFFAYRHHQICVFSKDENMHLERYAQLWMAQNIFETVDFFLTALIKGCASQEGEVLRPPAVAASEIFTMIGIDWVSKEGVTPLMDQLLESRKIYSNQLDAGNKWLKAQWEGWEQEANALRVHRDAWEQEANALRVQRDAWEEEANTLRVQRDACMQAVMHSEDNVQQYQAAFDGLRSSRLFRLLLRFKLLKLSIPKHPEN